VLPRLFRTLLNVGPPVKDNPGDTFRPEPADLAVSRSLVRSALPG
jgi:hypothetical protein